MSEIDSPFGYIQQALHIQCTASRNVSNFAPVLNKTGVQLGNELNPMCDRNKLGFTDGLHLITLLQARNIVELIAQQVGCTLLPMPDCKRNSSDQLREVLRLSEAVGKLCGEYNRSVSADSELGENLSPNEKRELIGILNKLSESVQCLKWELGQ